MKKDPTVYLEDIAESIGRIEEYTRDFTLETFIGSTESQDAVMRRLEIIGEAVKNLPISLRTSYPDVPWKQIAGMRDVLIHEYAGVVLDRVWNVVVSDLPPLKATVLKMQAELQNKEGV